MNAAIVNCSPRGQKGVSGELAKLIKEKLPYAEMVTMSGTTDEFSIKKLLKRDVIVMVCPLYVDGLPAQTVEWLERVRDYAYGRRLVVYCVINCGFFEGEQTRTAMEIVRCFCNECDFSYGGGLGIGSGGMTHFMLRLPVKPRPLRRLNSELRKLAEAAGQGRACGERFLSMGFSARIYKLLAEASFRLTARRSGARI